MGLQGSTGGIARRWMEMLDREMLGGELQNGTMEWEEDKEKSRSVGDPGLTELDGRALMETRGGDTRWGHGREEHHQGMDGWRCWVRLHLLFSHLSLSFSSF